MPKRRELERLGTPGARTPGVVPTLSHGVPPAWRAFPVWGLVLLACSSNGTGPAPPGDAAADAAATGSQAGSGSAGSGAAVDGATAGASGGAGSGAAGSSGGDAADAAVAAGRDAAAAAGRDGGDGQAGGDADAIASGAVVDCRDMPTFSIDPELAQRYVGDNGTFADSCSEDGNLLKYACEMIPDPACMPVFPNPPPCPLVATGVVIEQAIDCVGQCGAGACEGTCPDFGDRFELLAVDGDSVLLSSPDPSRRLRCTLIFDQPNDSIDCNVVQPGARGTITSLGLQTSYCTGGAFGNIGACLQADCSVVGQNCSYACSIEPA